MKVMLRNTPQGLSAYVPKKDLEEPVGAQENAGLWGGTITLANGWIMVRPDRAAEASLRIAVEARKGGGE